MRNIVHRTRRGSGGHCSGFGPIIRSLLLAAVLLPGSAAADDLSLLLPGLDGLGVGLDLQIGVSAAPLTGIDGNLHLALSDPGIGLGLDLPGETGRLVAVLPGLDGLGTSSLALDNALDGAAGDSLRALLGEFEPKLLRNVTGSLAAPLPGLEAAAPGPLPGIDGLPITLPER